MAAPCDDCAIGCRDGCAFVRPDEQPYFQAYRVARRFTDDDYRTWDFIEWIRGQWASYERAHGLPYDHFRSAERDRFQAWLFASVGHPAAT